MTHILLLGAGASVEAGIPGTADMVRKIDERIERFDLARRSALQKSYVRAFRFIMGALLRQNAIQSPSLYPGGLDVEQLFATIDALAKKEDSDLAPCIAGWDRALGEIEASIRANVNRSPFSDLSGIVKDLVVNLTWLHDPAVCNYLSPIIDQFLKQGRLVVATLNYDTTIELQANAKGVVPNRGLAGWTINNVIDVSTNELHLLKLHGSADWGLVWPNDISDAKPIQIEEVQEFADYASWTTARKAAHIDHGIIFGRGNKLNAKGPFLELLRAFRRGLEQAETLTVIGYSFRDDHINAQIARWFNMQMGRVIRIVSPNLDANAEQSVEFAEQLRRAHLRFPARVEIIKMTAGNALAQSGFFP